MLVTGVDTYVGAHVALCAMYNGFKVRGTVQNMNDSVMFNQLKNAFGDKFPELQLQLFQDRLDSVGKTANLATGCKFVVHAHQVWIPPSGPSDQGVWDIMADKKM